jgi:hypothetical protein
MEIIEPAQHDYAKDCFSPLAQLPNGSAFETIIHAQYFIRLSSDESGSIQCFDLESKTIVELPISTPTIIRDDLVLTTRDNLKSTPTA